MNKYSFTSTRRTVLEIGAVCANLLAGRIPNFLWVARNRERPVVQTKEIANESVDEMLFDFPVARTTYLSNTADLPTQYLSRASLSPFGDW